MRGKTSPAEFGLPVAGSTPRMCVGKTKIVSGLRLWVTSFAKSGWVVSSVARDNGLVGRRVFTTDDDTALEQ